jgi:outer membrane protein OmpA-like peptidoglycan-associated protein
MRKLAVVFLGLALIATLSGCASMKKRDKGAIIGAAAGAITGAAIGNKAGSTAAGAIIGAAIGGAAGAYIGNYMDRQADEMRQDIRGAKIERVGEGIKITFASGILFDIDKSNLRPEAKANLDQLARILNKYDNTNILVEGHTDSTGSAEHNMTLSISRGESVARYLAGVDVNPTRFTVMGYGETQPTATNSTPEGRQQNRRVEIAIFANDKLKQVAKERTS